MKKYLYYLLLGCLTELAFANEPFNGHTDFENYSVHYSFMSSTFIPADIAKIYGIKRSKYENLVNVSLSPVGQYGALPARVTGTVTNLMQQQKSLDFQEIAEKTATYYIAPIRVAGEETLHFELLVTPQGSVEPLTINFSKKIYSDP